jgi:hypothetical protein
MKPETAAQLASAYARAWQVYKSEPCTVTPDKGYFLVSPGGRFQRRRTAAELIRGLDALLHYNEVRA